MTLQCRTCGNVIYNTNAKNIFHTENTEILINIQVVVGATIEKCPELPSHICACCLLDLKQAVFHIKLFRERCVKTQERLLSLQTNIESPSGRDRDLNSFCDIKEATIFNYENIPNQINRVQYDFVDELNDFHEEGFFNDNDGNLVETHNEDSVNLVTSVHNELSRIRTSSSDSKVKTEELEKLSDSDLCRNDSLEDKRIPSYKNSAHASFTNLLIRTPRRSAEAHKATRKQESIKLNIDTNGTPKVKKTYNSWKNLTEEQIINRRRIQRRRDCICDQCGRHFTDQSNFKLHLLRHTGVKNFKCKECNKLFYTDHLLQLHNRTLHWGERPYACKYCEKAFNSSTTRVMHERSHTNVRPYSCEYCDKSFISTSALKRHDLTHNGVRAFYCNICDKTFQRNTHLKAHLRSKLHALRETNIKLLREFE